MNKMRKQILKRKIIKELAEEAELDNMGIEIFLRAGISEKLKKELQMKFEFNKAIIKMGKRL